MDRRDVLKALLAGGAVAALPGSAPKLTEVEFDVLALCAGCARENPSFERDGAVHALMERLRERGMTTFHEGMEGPSTNSYYRGCYEATDYGRSVLRAECERS